MQLTVEKILTPKGAPISILMGLALIRQPVSTEWMETEPESAGPAEAVEIFTPLAEDFPELWEAALVVLESEIPRVDF